MEIYLGSKKKHKEVEEILLKPENDHVLASISEIMFNSGKDESLVMLSFLEHNEINPDLLDTFIDNRLKEYIDTSINPINLFRQDDYVTRMLNYYSIEKGLPFLKKLLCPIFNIINILPISFEIDPKKIHNKFFLKGNIENLKEICLNLLHLIRALIPQIPR